MSVTRRSRRRMYDPEYYDGVNVYGQPLPPKVAAAAAPVEAEPEADKPKRRAAKKADE